ncbi:MAG: UDP-N-acetylglucosamine 1-carboxyvinyltransferase, partial [Dongiaceae bacterium]
AQSGGTQAAPRRQAAAARLEPEGAALMAPQNRSSSLIIEGGRRLRGSITVNGSKNATLGAMAASLLVHDECILENVPRIGDVEQMRQVLRSLGAEVEWLGPHVLRLKADNLHSSTPPTELVASLRGSFLVMGALLGRLGEAACSPPGGDVIGQRPIDVHLSGFAALGADVSRDGEKFVARAHALNGATVFADYPSVLGTQNLMLAAVTARGRTRIVNAAAEPEVQGLADMLQLMGAQISGAGTHTIEIEGVERLRGTHYAVIPDRLEAGTYAIAAALTKGEIEVQAACPEHLLSLTHKLQESGVHIEIDADRFWVRGVDELRALTIQALPYPGLATDLQALVAVLLTQADGVSYIHERVFDNRLLYVSELRKMGAEVVTTGTTTAIISGPTPLIGAQVRALDVRAGAALILA